MKKQNFPASDATQLWQRCCQSFNDQTSNFLAQQLRSIAFIENADSPNQELALTFNSKVAQAHFESKYASQALAEMRQLTGNPNLTFSFQNGVRSSESGRQQNHRTVDQLPTPKQHAFPLPFKTVESNNQSRSSRKFSRERYIESDCNLHARNAINMLLHDDDLSAQALLLTGDSGNGKTHLLNVAATQACAQGKRVLFCKAGEFGISFTRALSLQDDIAKVTAVEQFRTAYSQCDLLVIDDVQTLYPRMKAAQREFDRMFDTLTEGDGTVLMSASSTLNPNDFRYAEKFAQRIGSLVQANIDSPSSQFCQRLIDRELLAIDQMAVSSECQDILINGYTSTVRTLEAAITCIKTTGKLNWNNPQQLIPILGQLEAQTERTTNADAILETLCANSGYAKADVLSRSRKKELVHTRQICMYLLRTMTNKSFPEIADILRNSHTTCMHGYNKIKNEISSNPAVRKEVNSYMQILSRPR